MVYHALPMVHYDVNEYLARSLTHESQDTGVMDHDVLPGPEFAAA